MKLILYVYFFVLRELNVHYPCLSQGIAFDTNPIRILNCATVCSDLIVLV